jgi:hypothetical protein
MYTYREQLEMINGVRVLPNQHRRMDCPFCGGRNTFSVSNTDGSLKWNCYKASCGAGGVQSVGRTPEQVRRRLEGSQQPQKAHIPIPSILSSPDHHPAVLRYLERNGSMDAYKSGLCQIRYEPASDRVLFFMPHGRGAVGRSLRGDKPKWKAYGDTAGLLTVGSGPTVVLVEDAASACAVSRLNGYTGAALMGTNLSPLQRVQLMSYSMVLIALDKDASRKALSLKASLDGTVPVRVRFLEDDLKYLTVERLRSVL